MSAAPRCATFETSYGVRVTLTARHKAADPEALFEAIGKAWQAVSHLTIANQGLFHLLADEVRQRSAPSQKLDTSRPGKHASLATDLLKSFQIDLEATCRSCHTEKVHNSGYWPDLRDALAPATLPAAIMPRPLLSHVPEETELLARLEVALDTAAAERLLQNYLRNLRRYVCQGCLTSTRERLTEHLEGLRSNIEECAKQRNAQLQAQRNEEAAAEQHRQQERARLRAENPPYVTVVVPAGKVNQLGQEVSTWIRKGYRVWGAPMIIEGQQVVQALLREDVRPKQYRRSYQREEASEPSRGILRSRRQ